jgi:hypothetical protein
MVAKPVELLAMVPCWTIELPDAGAAVVVEAVEVALDWVLLLAGAGVITLTDIVSFEVLPDLSITVATMLCFPSAITEAANVQLSVPFARAAAPPSTLTVTLASSVPLAVPFTENERLLTVESFTGLVILIVGAVFVELPEVDVWLLVVFVEFPADCALA